MGGPSPRIKNARDKQVRRGQGVEPPFRSRGQRRPRDRNGGSTQEPRGQEKAVALFTSRDRAGGQERGQFKCHGVGAPRRLRDIYAGPSERPHSVSHSVPHEVSHSVSHSAPSVTEGGDLGKMSKFKTIKFLLQKQ